MRLLWIDGLKIIAIFGVILLHVSAPFVVPFETSGEWWIGNIYDSSSRWCVPLFIMASGALLLHRAENVSLPDWFLTRMRKVLVPFFAWSAVYFLYRIYFKGDDALTLWDFFSLLFAGPVYYHLWFVYMLIVLYLFAPALSVFVNKARPAYIWYVVIVWFVWTAILPIIDKPLNIETYYTSEMDNYSALRLSGYFILGNLLKDSHVRTGWGLVLVSAVFLAGLAATAGGTYLLSESRGEFHPFFYNYHSITVFAMTVSLFLFIKSLTPNDRHAPKPIQVLGTSVFGIYLAHALVIETLSYGYLGFTIEQTGFMGKQISLWAGIPLFALSVFVLSLLIILVLSVLPIFREIFT
jgi:surface polysaccharide O-acyltransferase-like enzyme